MISGGDNISGVEALGGMSKAIEAGIPKLRIEEAAAKTQARIDFGKQAVIGVNKFRPENERPIDVLKVENAAVRAQQIDKLKRLRAERNEAETQAALDALTEGAKSGANLLALSIEAARKMATVGEIPTPLERCSGVIARKSGAFRESTSGRPA